MLAYFFYILIKSIYSTVNALGDLYAVVKKLEDITVNQNVISVASGTNLIVQPSGTGIVDINSTQAIGG